MSDTEGVKEEIVPTEKEQVKEKVVNDDEESPLPSSTISAVKPSPEDYAQPPSKSPSEGEEKSQKETSHSVTNSVRFDDTPQVFEDNSSRDDSDDKDLENGGNEAEFERNNVINDEDSEGRCEVDDEEGDEDFDEEEEDEGERSHDNSSAESLVPDMERELGDGQESDKKDKKNDQGEDRRDPQYIPKRGVFYEHDDRTLEEDPEPTKEPVREPKKNKAFESAEKWGHDMYDESNQTPKSTEELIEIYGYDIRNEEAPPKARRRRRYGKGPNKYQRSWEDEQAYNKTPVRGSYRGRRAPRNFVQRDGDFPQLPEKHSGNSNVTNSGANDIGINRAALKAGIKYPQIDNQPINEGVKGRQSESGGRDKSPAKVDPAERPRTNSNKRGGNRGGGRVYTQVTPFGGGAIRSGKSHGGSGQRYNDQADKRGKEGSSTADEDIATLAQHFSNAVINIDKNIAPIRSQSETQDDRLTSKDDVTQPPHGPSNHPQTQLHNANALPNKHHQSPEPTSIKSKRYSNQRQRPQQPMPSGGQVVTSGPPPVQSVPQPQTTQGSQPAMPGAPAPNYLPPQPGYYPPQHGMCPPVPPDTSAHMAGPPSQFPPPPGGMQMVTFLPTVPPPANAYQPPPACFVQPAPYITPPPPIVQPPPAELYQGGVTYYNTQSQQPPRAVPNRRVKLAIPIVSPDSTQTIQ